MLLYAISSRNLFFGSEPERHQQLIAQALFLAQNGVDYFQIREKDLCLADLAELTRSVVRAVRSTNSQMQILLNGPAELALRSGCDGVHLPGASSAESALEARARFAAAHRSLTLSAACHSPEDARIGGQQVNLLLFAPVFEKQLPTEKLPGQGLRALAQAIRAAQSVPVLALGGITAENASTAMEAGASGIAAIRLFQSQDWRKALARNLG